MNSPSKGDSFLCLDLFGLDGNAVDKITFSVYSCEFFSMNQGMVHARILLKPAVYQIVPLSFYFFT